MTRTGTLIAGIGNRYRGDDAFGCKVAHALSARVSRQVKCVEHDGEPAALIECWQGYENVILIDAVSSGAQPGQIFRFDLVRQALPEAFKLYSTQAFGVPQAVELARALGKLPRRIRFIGVEGDNFEAGEALSPSLVEAREIVIGEILALLGSRRDCAQ